MTYIRPHNHANIRRNRVIAAIFIAVAFGIGVIQLSAPFVFPALFNAIARPFWREKFAVTEGALRSPAEILAENETLKAELKDLQMGYASSTIALRESEYRDILTMFSRASSSPKQYILAAVLARPVFMPYDELTLDVGQSDGLSSTSLVYSAEKVLIGHVKELLAHSAKVSLYSSPGEKFPVLIGPKHIQATAEGRGGGQYRADVPHGSGVQVGDFVSDSALYDRAFGVVVSIVTDPASPFDTVLLAPPVNIYQIRFVFVDKPILTTPVVPSRR